VRASRDCEELLRQSQDLAALLDLTGSFAASADTSRVLYEVVHRLAGRLSVERCSVLLAEPGGLVVVAASDDPAIQELRVDEARYPEVTEALRTRRPLVIADARHHPLLDPVRAQVEALRISSIAVVPMLSEGEVVGALVLRSRTRAGFTSSEVGFLSTVANALAVALRSAGRLQTERTQEVQARIAAEREVHQLRRYEDVFSHVSDGMAVLDNEGRVLLLNPAGAATLGLSPAQAKGLNLSDLVAPGSAMAAALLWREISRGGRVLSVDLELQTRDGRSLTLEVSAGQLRSQQARAILSFRDVTESRGLEAELRQTKEFLERLIDATVDGIVAADLRGRILLWNKGAERVTGYSAAEVVGKLNVAHFYPPGQARPLMKQLRRARASGEQVAPVQGEILSRSGEPVPVSLSIALVAEGKRETATVGIFRDLREQQRTESELTLTRERLAIAEKAALVSELAGAAAHELNQPLTSVLGFSELLFRRTSETDPGHEELAAIVRETERMAGIVRKIGRIVRYETTPYVGTRRIVDLDRSSQPPPVVIDDKP
jgi:PAS domain S-box-containing protein